eukprot:XP_015583876.1 uncharacterized protein LOC107262450 [Ricinus communis]
MEKICRSPQQEGEANAAQNPQDGEQMFVASWFTTSSSTESWLIDSGCTNHLSYDRELFKELHPTAVSKVIIENGAHVGAKGKGTVAIKGHTGLKFISDVLYVLEINQNLLSVAQLLEKGYKKNNLAKGLPQLEKELKFEVADIFWKFKAFVETQSGCKMQIAGVVMLEKKIKLHEEHDDIDHEPVRGTQSLSDIYQRCNVAVMELAGYEEAAADKKWMAAMKEELSMIENN